MMGDPREYQDNRSRDDFRRRQRMEAEADLARCFREAIASPSPGTLTPLKDSISQLAKSMRVRGIRPERALVELKGMLEYQSAAGWSPSLSAVEPGSRSHVYQQLFKWWLEAYYAQAPTQ
jgi:hypothetical protein